MIVIGLAGKDWPRAAPAAAAVAAPAMRGAQNSFCG